MYKETFASKLKKARTILSYTQKEVESETGIKQSTLASYETGRTEPDIETLGILADLYNISLDWLIGTNGKNNKNIIIEKIPPDNIRE